MRFWKCADFRRIVRLVGPPFCLLQLAASSFRRERQGGGYEACSGEATLADAS